MCSPPVGELRPGVRGELDDVKRHGDLETCCPGGLRYSASVGLVGSRVSSCAQKPTSTHADLHHLFKTLKTDAEGLTLAVK